MRTAFFTREELTSDVSRTPVTIYHILPQGLSQPVWLAAFGFVPWVLLLAANFYLLHPVWGEMSPEQLGRVQIWLGAAVAMALLHAGVAGARALRREGTRLPEMAGLVLLAVGYLWLSVVWCIGDKMVPTSVSRWILPPENLLGIQFCLASPPLFYALLRLACFETRSRFMAGPVASIVAATLAPALLFGGGMLISFLSIGGSWLFSGNHLPEWAGKILGYGFMAVAVAFTVLTLAGVLRLGAGAYLWTSGMTPLWKAMLNASFCLLMPLGGLVLNMGIPFPTDFQNVGVYLLTVINGALLTWPVPADRRWQRVRWVAVAALFPFSLYFFLIFLPWMPLALLAMMAFGAGFLILAPIILFAVHLQEMMQGWQRALDDGGGARPWVVVAFAVAILPGFLLLQALADRAALRAALDYAHRAPYQENLVPVDAARAASTLHRMRDLQQGLYMPILSETYKAMVFDGMVLQQEKIRQLHLFYSGTELPATRPSIYRGAIRQEATVQNRALFNPFANGKVTAHPVLSNGPSGSTDGWARYVIDLGLRNESSQAGEYVGKLLLPEGMWVTGLELDLNGTMVPAKVFEKKTALWIYQKIRDTEYSRDPGLVMYTGPGEVEVRVFPFTSLQARPARLTLLAAPGVVPDIRLDGGVVSRSSSFSLPPAATRPAAIQTNQGTLVVLPPGSFPLIERPREVHFIIDRSLNGMEDDGVSAVIRRVMAEMGPVQARVSEANYRSVTHNKKFEAGSTPVFQLKCEGGFAFERAVKTVMAVEAESSVVPPDSGPTTVFVAVTKKAGTLLVEERGQGWLRMKDDEAVYGVATPSSMEWKRWSDGKPAEKPAAQAVGVVGVGAAVHTVIPSASCRVLEFPGENQGPAKLFIDGGTREIDPMDGVDPDVLRGLEAWMAASRLDLFPEKEGGLFPEAVRLAKEAGILTPPTSFMIVENSAQWKMLERKEKQKTAAAKEFDFEEAQAVTPEPATWTLLGLGVAVLWAGRSLQNWKKRSAV